jgi:hypothetical protein
LLAAAREADQDRDQADATREYFTFQLPEVAVTRNIFAAILDRIARLTISPPIAAGRGV